MRRRGRINWTPPLSPTSLLLKERQSDHTYSLEHRTTTTDGTLSGDPGVGTLLRLPLLSLCVLLFRRPRDHLRNSTTYRGVDLRLNLSSMCVNRYQKQ